jgi:hypothetical protein
MSASHQHRSASGERGDYASGTSPRRLPGHLVPIRVQPDRPPRPLTRGQAAQLLGRHARTIDRWSRLNLLRTIDLGGTVRIPADEAQRLLSSAASRGSA